MDERQKLASPEVSVRAEAAEALSLMGPDAAFAAVELVKACGDEESVRDPAVAALEELGEPPENLIPDVAGLLDSKDPLVQYWAITLLGRSGEVARSHQDSLARLLQGSPDSSVKERAAWALGRIGFDSQAATQALESAAKSSEPRLARVAKSSLSQVQA